LFGGGGMAIQEAKPIRGDRLMKPDEVAEALRVSVKTVYLLVAKNELPPHKIGCSLRFDSADVDDYIFFSKYRRDNFHLTPSDKEELFERIDAQIDQAKFYMEKILGDKTTKKEARMKK
jgi:excisionase family DNA binding protein